MVTRNHYAESEMITNSQKAVFGEISANESLCIVSRFHLNVTSQETDIFRLFQKHLLWRNWMVTRNHYVLNGYA